MPRKKRRCFYSAFQHESLVLILRSSTTKLKDREPCAALPETTEMGIDSVPFFTKRESCRMPPELHKRRQGTGLPLSIFCQTFWSQWHLNWRALEFKHRRPSYCFSIGFSCIGERKGKTHENHPSLRPSQRNCPEQVRIQLNRGLSRPTKASVQFLGMCLYSVHIRGTRDVS